MINLILGVFHHFCKSARSASRHCENFMESLHSNDSATHLLAQVHYKTKIVRCTNVLLRIIDLLIMY